MEKSPLMIFNTMSSNDNSPNPACLRLLSTSLKSIPSVISSPNASITVRFNSSRITGTESAAIVIFPNISIWSATDV